MHWQDQFSPLPRVAKFSDVITCKPYWQDQFSVDPCHLTLCFIVDNWTYQRKLWPCRPANKHQQKERKKWKRVWRHATWPKKKHLRISPALSEYAAHNASGCLDTCKRRKRFDPTRVNAPKISGSLTSGYPGIRISGYVQTQPKSDRI